MTDDPGLFEIMYSLRSMRRLKPDPVPDDLVYIVCDHPMFSALLKRSAEARRLIKVLLGGGVTRIDYDGHAVWCFMPGEPSEAERSLVAELGKALSAHGVLRHPSLQVLVLDREQGAGRVDDAAWRTQRDRAVENRALARREHVRRRARGQPEPGSSGHHRRLAAGRPHERRPFPERGAALMSLRTPLAKVRGLGSAKEGADHFWLQRVTAVANLVLGIFVLWLIWDLAGADHARVKRTLANPLVGLPLILFVVSMATHMRLGMQVIIEDYVHGEFCKVVLLMLNTFFAILVGAGCVYAVLKLGFGA